MVGRDGEWVWQTWIAPFKGRFEAYRLPKLESFPESYGAEFSVSPDERYLFMTQKTGSGDNYGVLYLRGKSGRYASVDPMVSFDATAWRQCDTHFHFANDYWECRYHEAIGFVGWEPDRETFGVRLQGHHCFEDYYLSNFRLHYNVRSKNFFMTADDKRHNRRSVGWKNWRRPDNYQ